MDESGVHHVAYDSGVGELRSLEGRTALGQGNSVVDLLRVGILKDIVVLDYGSMNVVLMVVSWVAKDSPRRPRLRRDPHGFWLANMAAMPRDTRQPYMMPVAASQVVAIPQPHVCSLLTEMRNDPHTPARIEIEHRYAHVFFVNDKGMPGWSVVLAKEARGRRDCPHVVDHALGQEQSNGDLEAYSDMRGMARQEDGKDNEGMASSPHRHRWRRTAQ